MSGILAWRWLFKSNCSVSRMLAMSIAIAAGFTAWMYVCDWWGLNHGGSWFQDANPWPRKALLIYRIFGAVVASWLVCGLAWWLARSTLRARLLFMAWLIPMGVLYAAAWPGYMLTDSVFAIRSGFAYPVDLWLGFFQPFFYATILQLAPHLAAILLIQLVLAAALVAHVSEGLWALTGRRFIVALWAILILASPAMMSNFALLTRDILFCMGVVWLAVFVFRAANGHIAEVMDCLFGGMVAALVVAIRTDGWLVAIPFLIAAASLLRARRAMITGVAVVLGIGVYAVALPRLLGDHKDDFNYKVANTLNPLGYVLQSKFHTDRDSNLPHIAKVVNVEKIAKLQTPYEIPSWWEGDIVKEPGDSQARKDYIRRVAGLFRENIGIFLAGRVETLVASAGMAAAGFRFADAFTVGWPFAWVSPASVHLHLGAGRPFPQLSQALWSVFNATTTYYPSGFSGSILWWNFFPWLAILLFAPYLRTEYRGLIWVVVIGCLRVPLVFLGAPAAQFKYYLPVYMLGIFVFVVLVAHFLDAAANWNVARFRNL